MTKNGRFLTVHSKAEISKTGNVRIKVQEFRRQSYNEPEEVTVRLYNNFFKAADI
jgi:hypothetical protein